jgi:hypothetical protein
LLLDILYIGGVDPARGVQWDETEEHLNLASDVPGFTADNINVSMAEGDDSCLIIKESHTNRGSPWRDYLCSGVLFPGQSCLSYTKKCTTWAPLRATYRMELW